MKCEVASQSNVAYRARVKSLGITVGPGNGLSPGGPGSDTAFLTSQDGTVFKIKGSTGTVFNQYTPDVTGVCTTLVDWNDAAHESKEIGAYAIGNHIIILDSDGNKFDSFFINQGEVTSQPIVHADLVYVVSNSDTTGYVSIYDPYKTNPTPPLFYRESYTEAKLGPLAKGENGVYFGTNTGIVAVIKTANRFDPGSTFFATISTERNMRGQPILDGSSLVMQSPGGTLYGWSVVEGSEGNLLFEVPLGSDSAGDSLIAPVKSGTSDTFFFVSGSSTVALSIDGSILWKSEGEVKTKPVLEEGGTVITVEQSGEIKKEDALTGAPGSSFTPLCSGGSCGTATGHAMLTEDKSLVMTIHDTGWLVAVPTSTSPEEAPLATGSPVTSAPVGLVPITDAPATKVPITDAPITLAPIVGTPVAPPSSPSDTSTPVSAETKAPITDAPITLAPIVRTPVAPAFSTSETSTPVSSAPVTLSVAPVTLSAAPVALSAAPVPLSAAPVTLSAAPVPLSAAPVILSAAPVTLSPTTAAPTKRVTAAPTTAAPTEKVTDAPTTAAPTKKPTASPTTAAPTKKEPSLIPSLTPSLPTTSVPVRRTPFPVSSVQGASGASSRCPMTLMSVLATMTALLIAGWM